MRAAWAKLRTSSGFASAGGHLAVIAFAQLGLPFFFTPPPVTATVIPVDVVRLDDVTRPPPAATPEPEPEVTRTASPQPPPRPPQPVPEPPAPKPVAKADPAPPPPPKPDPVPPKPEPPKVEAPVPTPEPPPVEAKPEPPEPEPVVAEPEPEPVEAQPEPEPLPQTASVQPKTKPAPPERKPEPKPEPQRNFDSILKDLAAEDTKKQAPERARTKETAAPKGEEAPEQSRVSELASIREQDRLGNMIREQVSPCWSPPPGARDADSLLVSLQIVVDPQGNVSDVTVVDAGRMVVDNYFRSAAESARRAVLKCAPLRLPAEQYDIWKNIRFNFDPSKMLS